MFSNRIPPSPFQVNPETVQTVQDCLNDWVSKRFKVSGWRKRCHRVRILCVRNYVRQKTVLCEIESLCEMGLGDAQTVD